jgi:hypothetical protein
MAAMLHAARHPLLCQPAAHAPQHMLVHTECRPCSASCNPHHRQQRSRDVSASAKGRRAVTGDTLSEKLAELLPEHRNDAASQPQQQEPRRKLGRPRKQQNEAAEEEEDVEIFSIDGGWAADAMDSAAELASLLGRGSAADLDSATASSRGDDDDAAASSIDELEATWAAAAAEADAMLDTARGGAGGKEAWASDDDIGDDNEETEWTTSNFEFDSDDEEEEEEGLSGGAAVPLAEVTVGDCVHSGHLSGLLLRSRTPQCLQCPAGQQRCHARRTTTAGRCQRCRITTRQTPTASSGRPRCRSLTERSCKSVSAASCVQCLDTASLPGSLFILYMCTQFCTPGGHTGSAVATWDLLQHNQRQHKVQHPLAAGLGGHAGAAGGLRAAAAAGLDAAGDGAAAGGAGRGRRRRGPRHRCENNHSRFAAVVLYQWRLPCSGPCMRMRARLISRCLDVLQLCYSWLVGSRPLLLHGSRQPIGHVTILLCMPTAAPGGGKGNCTAAHAPQAAHHLRDSRR